MKPPSTLRTILVLGRVSNLPTIWTNVAVGWFLSGGGWTGELGWLILGMSLVYVAGMTLNDAFDAAWDREHAPQRPIPSERISQRTVWLLGFAQMGAGLAVLHVGTSAHAILLAGLVVAVFLYNFLHKRWAGAVLVMGLCRALVYLGAGSAVAVHTTEILVPNSLYLIAVGVVLYIAGLTLAARDEHLATTKRLGLLPRVLLTLPVLFPLLASRGAPSDAVHLSLAAVGVVGVWAWVVIVRQALAERIPKGIAFAIAGIALFDAAIVAFADWRAAVLCLACFVLTLGAQRVVPAT